MLHTGYTARHFVDVYSLGHTSVQLKQEYYGNTGHAVTTDKNSLKGNLS